MTTSNTPEELNSQMQKYWTIFGGLAALTLVSVGVSYLHLSLPVTIAIILVIATIKASLVLCYFMHLISTRTFIYVLLIFSVVVITGLFLLPVQRMGRMNGSVIVH